MHRARSLPALQEWHGAEVRAPGRPASIVCGSTRAGKRGLVSPKAGQILASANDNSLFESSDSGDSKDSRLSSAAGYSDEFTNLVHELGGGLATVEDLSLLPKALVKALPDRRPRPADRSNSAL